jgi:ribonucleoside-diphosphate reductase alpha chain
MESWRLGLKAVAVYRDGCKRSQPLSTSKDERRRPRSRRPRWWSRPARRAASWPTSAGSITHKFSIAGHEGYITVGMYEDGKPARSSWSWPRRARRSPA